MSNGIVVVTDHEFADLAPERAVIEGAGFTLIDAGAGSEEEIIAACATADGILNQYCQMTPRVIESLQNCRIISRYGIGLNTIDVAAATDAGIAVANVPDGSLDDVSDHALAMLLALSRGLGAYDRAIRAGRWDYTAAGPLFRLRGSTLGLLGFGQIPRRVAEKAQAFGIKVVAFDPYASVEEVKRLGVEPVELEELYKRADAISVHVPLTENTRGLVNEGAFASMKPTSLVINTARGPVIDEKALIRALSSGLIRGAGLDVFADEPLSPDSPLRGMENVLLSPHAAWYSEDSEVEIRTKAAQNIVQALRGERVTYQVNAI